MLRNIAGGWASSLRLRLTLWNVGVLALMLVSLGVALRYTLQATLIASVDGHMRPAAKNIQQRAAVTGQGLPVIVPGPHGWPPGTSAPDPNSGQRPPDEGLIHLQILDSHGHSVNSLRPPTPYDPAGYAAALAGRRVYGTVEVGGEPVRVLSAPLSLNGRVIGALQLPRPLTNIRQEVRRLSNVLLLLAAPALLIAGLGGAFLTSRALRPVREITHAAGRIEAEDMSGRLPVQGRDELSELAATFNGMLGRLEEAFRQRAAAYSELEAANIHLAAANTRLERANEQQRRFIADASHELKTPLTVIAGTASLSLSGLRTEAQYRQSLETVGRSAETMTRIVQDLLLLARSDSGQLILERRAVPVGDLLALACESAAGQNQGRIALTAAEPTMSVLGDQSQLTRLFVNLLDNAIRHTPAEGRVTITAEGDGEGVTVSVEDTGIGIAPEHLPHVFERFYRVDAARSRSHGGTGLGLAICRSIVEAHGGEMSIASTLGEGTQVRVRLPRTASAQPLPIMGRYNPRPRVGNALHESMAPRD